jgi:polyhydroxybutyrate depolymerase
MADDAHYGIGAKAGKMGSIVIFPNGISPLPSGMMGTWNAGNCCASARDKNIDDVGFVRKIIEDAKERWSIDPNRVYSTGMSNGAMISYRLACQLPEHIKAIAAVAGTDGMGECAPERPIPVLHIHALDDDHVLYNGGKGQAGRDQGKEAEFRSVPSTIDKWKEIDGCVGAPTRVFTSNGARCDRWMCSGAPVQLCTTDTGGHSWPGGGKTRAGKGSPSQAMSANDAMWEFFGQLSYASVRR